MCVHWWVLEPQGDEYSKGVCKFCNEVRMFRNGLSDADYIKGWYYKEPIERPMDNNIEAILKS